MNSKIAGSVRKDKHLILSPRESERKHLNWDGEGGEEPESKKGSQCVRKENW